MGNVCACCCADLGLEPCADQATVGRHVDEFVRLYTVADDAAPALPLTQVMAYIAEYMHGISNVRINMTMLPGCLRLALARQRPSAAICGTQTMASQFELQYVEGLSVRAPPRRKAI